MDQRAFQAQERAFQEHVGGQVRESGDETPGQANRKKCVPVPIRKLKKPLCCGTMTEVQGMLT